MHPSTALATVLVDELVRCGVREAVLSPGSRSAPLAYALHDAARAGRLRLHVRVDERSAAFLALGLGKVSRRPAVVVTTSGTAAANLHPAVLEAHHGQVPLLVLTADRPAELRDSGANQTTTQPRLYAASVRWEADVSPAQGRPGEQATWRTVVVRACAASLGLTGGGAGPAHLNVAFREPLVPDLHDTTWPEPLEGRPGGAPWVSLGAAAAPAPAPHVPALDDRALVVLGDLPDPELTREALELLTDAGRPALAEPFGAGRRSTVLPHGPLLLADEGLLRDHSPTQVLVVGRPTLSREVGALLRRPGLAVEVVTPSGPWADPWHVAARVHPWATLPDLLAGPVDLSWASAWFDAGRRLADRVGALLDATWPTGPGVARTVLRALGEDDTLVLGSSNPSRDADYAGFDPDAVGHPTVVANRGLAGIDGTVSTALGVALTAPGRTVALVGDLTFLHDSNGLLLGPDEHRPDLALVVVNDDGGGIFSTLEQGEPGREDGFERLFGTPTGTDLGLLCRAHGIPHTVADTPAGLVEALADPVGGVRVVEVRVDRTSHRGMRARLRALARGDAGA